MNNKELNEKELDKITGGDGNIRNEKISFTAKYYKEGDTVGTKVTIEKEICYVKGTINIDELVKKLAEEYCKQHGYVRYVLVKDNPHEISIK